MTKSFDQQHLNAKEQTSAAAAALSFSSLFLVNPSQNIWDHEPWVMWSWGSSSSFRRFRLIKPNHLACLSAEHAAPVGWSSSWKHSSITCGSSPCAMQSSSPGSAASTRFPEVLIRRVKQGAAQRRVWAPVWDLAVSEPPLSERNSCWFSLQRAAFKQPPPKRTHARRPLCNFRL